MYCTREDRLFLESWAALSRVVSARSEIRTGRNALTAGPGVQPACGEGGAAADPAATLLQGLQNISARDLLDTEGTASCRKIVSWGYDAAGYVDPKLEKVQVGLHSK